MRWSPLQMTYDTHIANRLGVNLMEGLCGDHSRVCDARKPINECDHADQYARPVAMAFPPEELAYLV